MDMTEAAGDTGVGRFYRGAGGRRQGATLSQEARDAFVVSLTIEQR